MARLPYLDKDDLQPEDRELLKRGINLHRMLVHSPGGCRAFGALGSWIRFKSTLDSRLREMAILQVGYLTRSPYEYSHHLKISRDFEVSEDDVRAIIAETETGKSDLPELDRTVLTAAREMTQDLAVSDATFAVLEAHLSKEHLVDLCIVIAFYNAVVRFLATLEVDVEDDYAPELDAFPLPAD